MERVVYGGDWELVSLLQTQLVFVKDCSLVIPGQQTHKQTHLWHACKQGPRLNDKAQ